MNPDVERLCKLAEAPVGPSNGKANEGQTLKSLILEIKQVLLRYVDFERQELATLIACWIVLTYCYETFRYCGYISLISATPRSGKTQTLRLIALLAYGCPPVTALPTAAYLYRSTRKVLLLDEVDRLRNMADFNEGTQGISSLGTPLLRSEATKRC